MVIGRSEDRDNPWDPAVLRHHRHVWDPIRGTHLGQRPSVPHTKAEHMTAIDQNHFSRCTALARPGAVHIWVPAGVYPRAGQRPDPGAGMVMEIGGSWKFNRDCFTTSPGRIAGGPQPTAAQGRGPDQTRFSLV
jgi:hypothetical protein